MDDACSTTWGDKQCTPIFKSENLRVKYQCYDVDVNGKSIIKVILVK
jgi:hypothetical protein